MSKLYTSKSDLEKYIISKTIDIMRKEFYKILAKTYDKYVVRWYSEFYPAVYPRKYEFRTKLPVEFYPEYVEHGNKIVCGLNLDIEALSHEMWTAGYYNGYHHVDKIHSQEDIVDNFLEGGHGFYKYTKTKTIEDSIDELNRTKQLGNILRSELKKAGFIVS